MADPRHDRLFKRIFHNHPRALMHLLNTFLPLPSPIEEVEYLPEELQSDLHGQYMSIVDVRCRDSFGRHFIVEMQLQKRAFYFRRLLYNATRVYSRQLEAGADVTSICPVYTLCLLEHSMFPGEDRWLHHAQPMLTGAREGLGELYFTIVEMQKWKKSATFDSEDRRDAWMMFFTKPEAMKDVFTPEQRQRYRDLWHAVLEWDLSKYSEHDLWIMDKKASDMMAHETYLLQLQEDSHEKGLEQGRNEGMQVGMRDGFEQAMHAMKYIKSNPSASDEELMAMFKLTQDTLSGLRSLLGG